MFNREFIAAAATIIIIGGTITIITLGAKKVTPHVVVATTPIHKNIATNNSIIHTRTDNAVIDRDALALAIADVETSGGRNVKVRFEPGFLKRYGNSGNMPRLRSLYGDHAAASSYGKFQIMLSTANQYADISPTDLSLDENNRRIYDKIIEKFISQYGDDEANLTKICLRYNGGGDKTYPIKVIKNYNKYKETNVVN